MILVAGRQWQKLCSDTKSNKEDLRSISTKLIRLGSAHSILVIVLIPDRSEPAKRMEFQFIITLKESPGPILKNSIT